MAITTPLFCADQDYPPDLVRLQFASVANPGVVSGLVVTPGSGLQVNISAGYGYVQQSVESEGNTFYNGLYFVASDSAANPYNAITAPFSNPRIDTVVFRVYDVAEQGLGGASFARFEWVQGTETSGATLSNLNGAPTLPTNSLGLVDVLQTVGETSISSGNIQVIASPSWVPITLSTNISGTVGAVSPTYVPSVRQEGAVVRFKGALEVTGTVSALASIATVPLKPTSYVLLNANTVILQISPLGVVSAPFQTLSSGNIVPLDGLTYTLS